MHLPPPCMASHLETAPLTFTTSSSLASLPRAKRLLFCNSNSDVAIQAILPLQAVEEAADTAGGPVGQALEAAGTLPFLAQSVPVEGGDQMHMGHPSQLVQCKQWSDIKKDSSHTIFTWLSQGRNRMAPPKMLWSNFIHIQRYIIPAKVGVPLLCLHPIMLLLAPLKDCRNCDSMLADGVGQVCASIHSLPNIWATGWRHGLLSLDPYLP